MRAVGNNPGAHFVSEFTGLPGSGKSSIADALREIRPELLVLRMDELRKVATPEPSYSEAERDILYGSLVYLAMKLAGLGHNVIIDATGNRKAWRDLARRLIPGFIEVYLKCPVEKCMARENKREDTRGAPTATSTVIAAPPSSLRRSWRSRRAMSGCRRAMLLRAFYEPRNSRGGGAASAAAHATSRARTLLTVRERQIFRLVRSGLTNKEVGRQLEITEDTVKKHLRNMYAKLGVRRRAQMLAKGAAEARASR